METTVIEVPSECKALAETMRALVDAVVAQMRSLGNRGRSVDYGKVEVEVGEKTAAVEREAHRALLGALDVDVPAVVVDGVRHSRAGRFNGSYYTLAGAVVIERTLYRSAEGPCFDAISLRAGVVGDGWLPRTARAMAQQVARVPSREAEVSAMEVGRIPYSRSSFERVAHLVGDQYVARHEDIEDTLIEAFDVPAEAASVSVSLDRVSVPMEEPKARPRGRPRKDAPKRPVTRAFRMAYCGTVTLHDAEGEALETIRYGAMPHGNASLLAQGLAADVKTLLHKRPNLKVAAICDGAPEMWNLLDSYVSQAELGTPVMRLVDFHHVIEKLGAAARVIDQAAASSLIDRWRFRLLNQESAATTILDELRASGARQDSNSECPVHAAITYLENHPGMFNYAKARKAGLPIGSGNVEATCKSLFELRFKRGGARWKHTSGEHIVHLRALVLSDRWAPAIDMALAPLRKAVRAA